MKNIFDVSCSGGLFEKRSRDEFPMTGVSEQEIMNESSSKLNNLVLDLNDIPEYFRQVQKLTYDILRAAIEKVRVHEPALDKLFESTLANCAQVKNYSPWYDKKTFSSSTRIQNWSNNLWFLRELQRTMASVSQELEERLNVEPWIKSLVDNRAKAQSHLDEYKKKRELAEQQNQLFLNTAPISMNQLCALIQSLAPIDECDHTFKKTLDYLRRQNLDEKIVLPWLVQHGGTCDCRVFINVLPKCAGAMGFRCY